MDIDGPLINKRSISYDSASFNSKNICGENEVFTKPKHPVQYQLIVQSNNDIHDIQLKMHYIKINLF